MNASGFGRRFRNFLFIIVLVSPANLFSARICSGQTDSKATRNSYVVSVQDLKMAGKGHAAFEKGSHMLAKGETEKSIAYLEQAIAQYPEHYEAYYDLGVAQFRLLHLAEAEQAFQKAIDLTKGNFAPPQFGLAAILCQKDEFPEAETLLQRAVELDPASAVGKYYLAWAQYGLKRLVEAERSAEQALLRDAKLAPAYLLLLRIHLHQHNLPGASKDLESYLKIEPRDEQAKRIAEQIKREMARDTAVVAAAQP